MKPLTQTHIPFQEYWRRVSIDIPEEARLIRQSHTEAQHENPTNPPDPNKRGKESKISGGDSPV